MKTKDDILYSQEILYRAAHVIIDDEVVKSRGVPKENLIGSKGSKVKERILLQTKVWTNDIIVIQEGREQKIYGPVKKLTDLEDFLKMSHCSTMLINGTIRLIPYKEG